MLTIKRHSIVLGKRTLFLLIAVATVIAFSYQQITRPVEAAEFGSASLQLFPQSASTEITKITYTARLTTALTGDATRGTSDVDYAFRLDFTDTEFTFPVSSIDTADVTVTIDPNGTPSDFVTGAGGIIAAATPDASGNPDFIRIDLDGTTAALAAIDIAAGTEVKIEIASSGTTTLPTTPAATVSTVVINSVQTTNDTGPVTADVDSFSVSVPILQAIGASATVADTLSVSIAAVTSSTTLTSRNSDATTVTTTSTSVPFGTLSTSTPSIAAQTLSVSTNAQNGYLATLSLIGNDNLTNSQGATINQFKNGVLAACTTTSCVCETWVAPTATAGSPDTYGHFGYGTDGTGVMAATNFCGFGKGSNMGVLTNVPNAVTGDATTIEYKVDISSLQETGTYTDKIAIAVVANY